VYKIQEMIGIYIYRGRKASFYVYYKSKYIAIKWKLNWYCVTFRILI